MKKITRMVEFDDRQIEVRELTVSEIRAWMDEAKADRDFDLITDLISFDGIGIDELVNFTDLTRDEVEQLPMSIMEKVAVVIKEVNHVFFNKYLPELNKLRQRIESAKSKEPSVS